MDDFVCPECDEVFNLEANDGVCPSCGFDANEDDD